MVKERNISKSLIFGLILISWLLFAPVMGAPHVDRDVSVSGDLATITFTVDGEWPFAVGIVETVPEGWSFAGDNSEVSSSENFEVDRENNKIAFFISNDDSASYQVTGRGDGKTGFTSEWVDLLYLSPDLNEGKERWTIVGESLNTVSKDDGDSETQKSPGFGSFAALIAFAAGGAILVAAGKKEA